MQIVQIRLSITKLINIVIKCSWNHITAFPKVYNNVWLPHGDNLKLNSTSYQWRESYLGEESLPVQNMVTRKDEEVFRI